MKYGFIGAGNIAEALISGMVMAKVADSENIFIHDINKQRVQFLEDKLNVSVAAHAAELCAQCAVIFLTVKPDIIGIVLTEVRNELNKHKPLIISIAAGKSIGFIEELLGFEASVARVMPNTNAAVAESMSLICVNDNVSEQQLSIIEHCFNAIGKTCVINEDKMPILTALCGCAPAFTYLFIESLAKAAHKNGVDKKTAMSLAVQTVLGSAKLLEQTKDKSVWEQIDAVCSPGGMTIQGVCSLEESGFSTAVLKAVEIAAQKDSKLK